MKWIPVKERLPEANKSVLVTSKYDGEIYVGIGVITCIGWYIDGDGPIYEEEISAWMPLPEPYKEEVI